MNTDRSIDAISIQPVQSVRRQVADQLRQAIKDGELTAGQALPSTRALAKRWNTKPSTVQQALGKLTQEGWLVRTPRVGTFVRQREAKLTCVGVLDHVVVKDSPFKMALLKALQEELQLAGIQMDLWLEPRPEEQFGEPWQPFWHAAAHREFQAVIVTGTTQQHLAWHLKLPLPTAFFTGPSSPNSVGLDFEQFAEASVAALAQQGCRSVGLIFPSAPAKAAGERHRPGDFYSSLMDRIGDRGLTIKNEWVQTPPWPFLPPKSSSVAANQERFGHEAFLRLWARPDRPDGLIVYPDTSAIGVILGLLEQQVRVPDDLKLVLHKNEAVDLYCPLAATFVVVSERKIARALIAQVRTQFRGKHGERILLPFDLVSYAGK